MAIVLPDGILGGSRVGYIPHFIRKHTKVLALVDLPKETFQPFVSTKTHLLCLQKKTASEMEIDEEYDIFLGIVDFVGHDRKGNPLFEDGHKINAPKDDIANILQQYEAFKRGSLTQPQFSQYGYVVSSRWLGDSLIARRYLPKFIRALEELERLQQEGTFELKTLGDIKQHLFTGANICAAEYVEASPYRYLMTDCITEFGINPAKFKYISAASYQAHKRKIINAGDILINRTGNSGIATIFPQDMAGVMACGFTFVLRPKAPYDPYYVAAFLNSRLGRLQTERCAFGSILDHITKDDVEHLLIPFPKNLALMEKISADFREVVENQMQARIGFDKFTKAFDNMIDATKTQRHEEIED